MTNEWPTIIYCGSSVLYTHSKMVDIIASYLYMINKNIPHRCDSLNWHCYISGDLTLHNQNDFEKPEIISFLHGHMYNHAHTHTYTYTRALARYTTPFTHTITFSQWVKCNKDVHGTDQLWSTSDRVSVRQVTQSSKVVSLRQKMTLGQITSDTLKQQWHTHPVTLSQTASDTH